MKMFFLGGEYLILMFICMSPFDGSHGGKWRTRIARHLCLHVKGCDVSVISVCLTYPRLWGRCICWVQLCCGCYAGVEALVQMAQSLSCSGGTVLVWEDQCQRIIHGRIMQHVFISETKVMLFFFISDDVAVTCLIPTEKYCHLLCLWVGCWDWEISPGTIRGPAVQTVTGLQQPVAGEFGRASNSVLKSQEGPR